MKDITFNNNFSSINLNQTYVIQMPSKFTSLEANSFKKLFQHLCQSSFKLKKIILDFAHTTFMDSSGLAGLCQILHLAKNAKLDLTLGAISPQVKIILSLVGLEQIFIDQENIDIINTDYSIQKANIHPAVLSRSKRLLDICGAVVGLAITGVLIVPIALAIKLDNPGSIFFSQIRCGYNGKKFRIWKFRSMVTNAEQLQHQIENKIQGPLFKNDNDPRITRMGRLLRKTSLDEFPQFWNVLKGEMSLVGTRPPTAKEVESYTPEYHQRLNVKPGLTGEWQVNGRSEITDFAEVLRLDLQYQKKWSVLYDLKLILKTIRIIFSKKSGAC
ncbi:MAG: sugar transferase [Xenococcaceae cyanobacterium MO_188.B19]|nr:sugar transferase [Xenococcaceae cyanobacterium MO_188.B19]